MLSANSQIPLSALQSLLCVYTKINKYINLEGCFMFIELVQILQGTLSLSLHPDKEGPIKYLPWNVYDFLKKCLTLDDEATKVVWKILSPIAWALDMDSDFGQKHVELFLKYGISNGIGISYWIYYSYSTSNIISNSILSFSSSCKEMYQSPMHNKEELICEGRNCHL